MLREKIKAFKAPSSQATSFFEANGFCLFRSEDREHAELISSAYDFFSNPLNRIATDFQVGLDDGRHKPRIFRDRNSPALKLFTQPHVREIIGAFFSEESKGKLFYTHSKLSLKSKKQMTGWRPHQDSGYKKRPNEHVGLSVMCLLEDMNEENGCLCICPGSHANGPLEHIRVIEAEGEVDGQLEVKNFSVVSGLPIVASAGDILVFDLNTVHYSERSFSESNRLAIITEVEPMRWYQLDADRRPPIPVYGNPSKIRMLAMCAITFLSPSFYTAMLKNLPLARVLKKKLRRLMALQ